MPNWPCGINKFKLLVPTKLNALSFNGMRCSFVVFSAVKTNVVSIIFSIPILIFSALIVLKADGNLDPFYIRFTTPKQKNMILGTSRAAQGLQPSIFDNVLNKKRDYISFYLLFNNLFNHRINASIQTFIVLRLSCDQFC